MKILHLLNHTFRLNGHVHQAIDLACAQARMGHCVSIASGGGDFGKLLNSQGVKSIYLNHNRRPNVLFGSAIKAASLIKNADLVHAHMVTSAVMAWPGCKIYNKPLVTTVHNEFEKSAIIMGLGNRVVAVSGAVKRSMEKRGIPRSRIRTVLNGTVGSTRHPRQVEKSVVLQSPSLLYVGGLHPRKGLVDLIAAFEIIYNRVPDVKLHIVGEGPREREYRELAANTTCAPSIVFHGGQNDPRPWFLAADVFVFPSHSEPAGLVLSEACEGGCAIVATNVGGIPEMLNWGKAGTMVSPHDPENLAKAIIQLITHAEALTEAKRNALENVHRLTVERMATQTQEVYDECIVSKMSER